MAVSRRWAATIGGILLMSFVSVGCGSVRYARSASGQIVTRDMVRGIELGAPESDVLAILGPPEKVSRSFFPGGRSLQYGGGPSLLYGAYTVVWVHLDDRDKVREVYSKLYASWSLDEEPGAYGRRDGGVWEGSVFTTAFPR